MTKSKKFILYALIVIGLLGIANTILIMKYSVGITLGVVLPGMIGIAFIAFSIINLIKKHPIFKRLWLKKTLIALLCVGLAFFMTVEFFIISNSFTKKDEDTEANFVIVLGCGIFEDGTLTLTLMKRLNAAIEYMERFPTTLCVVSGGQGPNEPYSEALAMKNYLVENGIDEDRIMLEDKSTSTKENLLYSSLVIYENYPCIPPTVAVVTSEFHIFRVKFLAKRLNMSAIGIASDTSWYLLPNTYLREFFAVIKSYLFDR